MAKNFFIISLLLIISAGLAPACSADDPADLILTKTVEVVYPPTSTPVNLPPIGALEGIDKAGLASGWAVDPDIASSAVTVVLYIDNADNAPVASVTASLARPDINQNTNYPGDHGFSYNIPQSYWNGIPHRLYAYALNNDAAQTRAELSGSGALFNLGGNRAKPQELTAQPVPTFTLSSLPKLVFSSPAAAKVTTAVNTVFVLPLTIFVGDPLGLGGGFLGLAGLSELWLIIERFLLGILTLLGLRKKRVPWGTVYDSQNKQPLDPAIVSLHDANTGKVVEQSITDLAGRFGFINSTGNFYLTAEKTHYRFPSEYISGTSDGIFENLYHGEKFEIAGGRQVIAPNIPMDPLAFDWNQQDKKKIIKTHPRLEFWVSAICSIVFWLAIVFTVVAFLASPGWETGFFLLLGIIMLAYKFANRHARMWGRIFYKSTAGNFSGFVLTVSHLQMPGVVLARSAVSEDGTFFLKAAPGKYLLSVLDNEKRPMLSQPIVVSELGLINNDFML